MLKPETAATHFSNPISHISLVYSAGQPLWPFFSASSIPALASQSQGSSHMCSWFTLIPTHCVHLRSGGSLQAGFPELSQVKPYGGSCPHPCEPLSPALDGSSVPVSLQHLEWYLNSRSNRICRRTKTSHQIRIFLLYSETSLKEVGLKA